MKRKYNQIAMMVYATMFGVSAFANCVGPTTKLRCFSPDETKPFKDAALAEAEAKRKRKAARRTKP